jgi:branched-chain amino acid transport system permease protein
MDGLSTIAEILSSGVPIGCLYALVAVSFNILYRPTRVFNFAQGDLVMVGAMVAATLLGFPWAPWPIAVLAAMLVVGGVCLIEERIAVRPVLERAGNAWVITTLAVALIIDNVVGKLWGADPLIVPPPFGLSTSPLSISGFQISPYQIALVAATALIVAVTEALYATRTGRAIKAIAEHREAALLRGIDPIVLTRYSFFAGGCLAALAGYLAAPLIYASTAMASGLLLKGFAAAAVGGVGSSRGALVAGVIIGVAEAAGAELLSAGYQQAVVLVVALALLLARPSGLFGAPMTRTV